MTAHIALGDINKVINAGGQIDAIELCEPLTHWLKEIQDHEYAMNRFGIATACGDTGERTGCYFAM